MVIPAWFGGNGEGGEEEEEPHGFLEHGADNIIAGLVGGREATAPGIYFAKQSQLWDRGLGLFVQNVFARDMGVFRGGGTKASRADQGSALPGGIGFVCAKARLYSIVKERGGRASREDVPCCAVAQNGHGWDFAKQSQSAAAAVLRSTYFWE